MSMKGKFDVYLLLSSWEKLFSILQTRVDTRDLTVFFILPEIATSKVPCCFFFCV